VICAIVCCLAFAFLPVLTEPRYQRSYVDQVSASMAAGGLDFAARDPLADGPGIDLCQLCCPLAAQPADRLITGCQGGQGAALGRAGLGAGLRGCAALPGPDLGVEAIGHGSQEPRRRGAAGAVTKPDCLGQLAAEGCGLAPIEGDGH
jgi:hypothetical protein